MNRFLLLILLLISFNSFANERIVSIGSLNTEILFALGIDKKIVGVDETSTYPFEVKSLTKVGYKRTLSAEGILSLRPDIILVDNESGPEHVLQQLAQNVKVIKLKDVQTVEGLKENINIIARIFNVSPDSLLKNIDLQCANLKKNRLKSNLKIAFLLNYSGRNEVGAGQKTVQDAIINIIGGKNSFDFTQYKTLNIEAMIASKPDYIIYTMVKPLTDIEKDNLINKFAIGKDKVIFLQAIPLLSFGPASLGEMLRIMERISNNR